MEFVSKYLTEVITTLSTGSAREHAYRPAFQQLIKSLKPELQVVNDPARSEHGAPDFVFMRGKEMTIGYAETKDIEADLNKVEKSEQLKRYFGYSNLILTNYIEFRFFKNGEKYEDPIEIGTFSGGAIIPKNKNYELLERTIKDFLESKPEKIKSGVRLAKIMGGKARRIRENVARYIKDKSEDSKELINVYEMMKKLLVHDLSPEDFADMYAQTLVYGLFVARFHDDTLETFSRQEARDLVPASNPLLRHFFDHIAGTSFDKRLAYIVNELCEIFSVAEVRKIMEQYYSQPTLWGETKESPDPVIHFYEDFLKEYDPDLRKKMGAFYTPLPIVRFIVRSVDYLLEKEFNLSKGLADTAKTSTGIHKVQILDPAVGTGTFISAIIRIIYQRLIKEGQKGRWPTYVHNDLLPRLHGFELMMAPYTIAHLKLSMAFKETGFKHFNRRLGIYLTNSLEESAIQENLFGDTIGFAGSIARESKEASVVKNETPIMVVVGNPPYSISSSNKSQWILDLIKDYKKNLGEQKINIDDDYIKFIRFAEHFIEKNKTGIVAMITNNSYIDGITHRQMRKHLLETFDDIYILDLHGNMRKGETDQNVFDIQQGVSIGIFIRKTENKNMLGKVHHAEILGTRKEKFEKLNSNSIETIKWKKLNYKEPYYFFVPKDFGVEEEYNKGFKITELFNTYSVGIKTKVDNISTDFNKEVLSFRIEEIINEKKSLKGLINKYGLNPKTTWEYNQALKASFDTNKLVEYDYRPFDVRYIFYDKNFLSRNRGEVMDNFFEKDNISIDVSRTEKFTALVSNKISDEHYASHSSYKLPLYIYPKKGESNFTGGAGNIAVNRMPNMSTVIARKIAESIGAVWYPVAEYPIKNGDVRLTPEDILDYIYAVLHSPSYREKYKEFLKIDFPRVPYPKDNKTFWKLVEKGKELRLLHLMESPKLQKLITTFPESGSNIIEKVKYENGNVYINETQYFGNVPEIAWNFYIGGYQPAQKWLKDRKGRTLSNQDLEHYQRIIIVLVETDKIMREIGKMIQFE